jgi:hypothetical protein
VVIVHRQPNLFEIVLALRPPARFTGCLYRRQQQRYQDADDGNHDQQLDERETPSDSDGTGARQRTRHSRFSCSLTIFNLKCRLGPQNSRQANFDENLRNSQEMCVRHVEQNDTGVE